MRLTLATFAGKHARRRQVGSPTQAETSEPRCLPSAVWPSVVEPNGNDTINISEDLGELISGTQARHAGTIGDTPELGADVDWFQFTLTEASNVTVVARSPDGHFPLNVALSLYNNTPLEFDDQFNRQGHRLLDQTQSLGQARHASLSRLLAPGTYFVAVSGAGNLDFNPFLVGSGHPGETGDYELAVSSRSLNLSAADGLTLLSADPATNANLSSSPSIIRVGLSGELDPSSISPNDTLWLAYSANDTFGDEDDMHLPLAFTNFSRTANELQLTPAAPLAPGYYQVFLAGDWNQHPNVLVDLNGMPLGTDADHPVGQDAAIEFTVNGIEGRTGEAATADDTPETAHELGDLTNSDLVQARGVIGDDPFYDPNIDWMRNPANDVDLYHFQVTGLGHFALTAEVFAGRIGSPLDSGVSLFRLNSDTGLVEFVAGNNSTYNTTIDSTASNSPLFTDSALFAGLTAGDYYVAVSSSFNTPSPNELQLPGSDGMFDPNVTHSGLLGMNTGSYVLNLQVRADTTAPTVIATNPAAKSSLSRPPERLTIQFSERVNVQQLAFDAYRQATPTDVGSVFVETPDGTKFYPRLESFDSATNQATFLMLDRLPDGINHLHLSGLLGLSDLAGNALVGNDASGDYVVPLTVASIAQPSGASGEPTEWISQGQNDDLTQTQNLEALFPREWQAGITVARLPSADQSDAADYFQFNILQNQDYQFTLSGEDLPDEVSFSVTDLGGNPVPSTSPDNRTLLISGMRAGSYVLSAYGWDASQAPSVNYQIHLSFLNIPDNAPPLTAGPAPAIQLRLSGVSASPTATAQNTDRSVAAARIPQVTLPYSAQPASRSSATFANFNARDTAQPRFALADWTKEAGIESDFRREVIARPATHSVTTALLRNSRVRSKEATKSSSIELDALKDGLFGRIGHGQDPSATTTEPAAPETNIDAVPPAVDNADAREQTIVPASGQSNARPVSSPEQNAVDVIFGRLAVGAEESLNNGGPVDQTPEPLLEISPTVGGVGWNAVVLAVAGIFSWAFRSEHQKPAPLVRHEPSFNPHLPVTPGRRLPWTARIAALKP